jgi:hypothetical protein
MISDRHLGIAVRRQKDPQIAVRDPDDAVNAVHDQIAARDPAPNSTRRNIESFGHRFDCVAFWETTTAETVAIGNIDAHDALPVSKINSASFPTQ